MADHPLTSHRRAEQNRRSTRRLVALFTLLAIPVLAFLCMYLGAIVVYIAIPAFGEMSELTAVCFYLAAVIVLLVIIVVRVMRVRNALPRLLGVIPFTDQEGAPIRRRLENLALAAGIPTPQLFLIRSPGANALSTGPDAEHASVILTEGLLHTVDRRGLDGVLAHEIAHITNEDVRLNSTLAAIVRTVRLPAPIYWLFVPFALISIASMFAMTPMMSEVANLWLDEVRATGASTAGIQRWLIYVGVVLQIMLALGCLTIIVWPALGRHLQSHVARHREFLADAEAATLTRDPIGLAQALRAISTAPARIPGSAPDSPRSAIGGLPRDGPANLRGIEHLCIAPAGQGRMEAWCPTHPPLSERIAELERMAAPEPDGMKLAAAEPSFIAAADAAVRMHEAPRVSRAPRRLAPFAYGMIAGGLVQTVVFGFRLLGAAGSPSVQSDVRHLLYLGGVGFGGAVAAYVAGRRKGVTLAWPSIVMLMFGYDLPVMLVTNAEPRMSLAGVLVVYLASLSEPLAGAALGAWAQQGLMKTLVDLGSRWRP